MTGHSKIIARIILPLVLTSVPIMAATNYVSLSGGAISPYLTWADAATNIQEAIVAAAIGNTVMVTNDTYTLTTNILIGKGITVISASSDPYDTIIDGNHKDCCVLLGHADAVLSGFKIINGEENRGAAAQVYSGSLITNCIICSNNATDGGGGLNIYAGSWARNCLIANNTATNDGGGVMIIGEAGVTTIVQNCTISNNICGRDGGGARANTNSVMLNCIIVNNTAQGNYGGGLILIDNPLVRNCLIQGNSCLNKDGWGGGGGVCVYSGAGTIRNCLLQGNNCISTGGGGAIYVKAAGDASISSCTIVSNSANQGGGIKLADGGMNFVDNCIFYQNIATNPSYSPNYNDFSLASGQTNDFSFCCALLPSAFPLPPPQGNITNYPKFVNTNAGNYRLQSGSPCINSGTNQAWMTGEVDLDGHRRIDRFTGMVDMGAYEYLQKGTMFIIH